MRYFTLTVMSILLLFHVGCGSKSPFEKFSGVWNIHGEKSNELPENKENYSALIIIAVYGKMEFHINGADDSYVMMNTFDEGMKKFPTKLEFVNDTCIRLQHPFAEAEAKELKEEDKFMDLQFIDDNHLKLIQPLKDVGKCESCVGNDIGSNTCE